MERMVENGAVALRTVAEGEGPVILCVHGWPELAYSWRHQQAHFAARGYRVVTFDLRGYGGSSKPDAVEAYTLRSLASDVAAVAAAYSDEPVVLFGHDWGAPVAYTTTLLHADRVRAIAGLSVPFLPPSEASFLDMAEQVYGDRWFYQLYFQQPGVVEAEVEADLRRALRGIYHTLSGDTPRDAWLRDRPATETLLEGLIQPETQPAWLSEADLDVYVRAFAAGGFRGPINRYRAQRLDVAELAAVHGATIAQPACFVAGAEDQVIRGANQAQLRALLEHGLSDLRGVHLLPGVGHWVQQEAPAAVNEALERFLASL